MSCCCRASQDPPEELRIVIVKVADNEQVLKTFMKSSEEYKTFPLSEEDLFTNQNLRIDQQKVVVIETPFLCAAGKTDEELKKELKECVSQSDPGPHVFLLVFGNQKFTKGKQNALDLFKNSFGKEVLRYTMAVFPFGKDLEKDNRDIEKYLEEGSPQLKSWVDKCKGGYHDIKDGANDPAQGTELLQKIKELVQKNKGRYYDIKQSENDEKLRQTVLRVLMVTAVVGACIGASVASYLTGNTVGLFAVLGALGGCVLGFIGIVAVERVKNIYYKCRGKCQGQRAAQGLGKGVTEEGTAWMEVGGGKGGSATNKRIK